MLRGALFNWSRMVTAGAGIALVFWGLWTHDDVPWQHLGHLSLDVLSTVIPIILLCGILARWHRVPLSILLLILGLLLPAMWLVGLPALVAVLLLGAASIALGSVFNVEADCAPWIHLLLGASLIAAVAGWLLPFRIHHTSVWIVVLLSLVWQRRHALRMQIISMRKNLGIGLQLAPLSAFLSAVALVIASLPAWLPLSMHDDLSYHLGLGTQLLEFGHARFNVGSQIWALAPWGSDVLQGIAMVISGTEVRGVLNVIWLLAAAMLVRSLALQLGLSHQIAWLTSSLYASLPLSSALMTSLQTETLTAALMVAIAHLGISSRAEPRRLQVIAVLAGMLLACKISAAAMAAPVLLLAVWRSGQALDVRKLVVALPLGVLVSCSSYTYAAVLTGNPLLPLYNAVFKSPWFALRNFHDPLWQKGFGDFPHGTWCFLPTYLRKEELVPRDLRPWHCLGMSSRPLESPHALGHSRCATWVPIDVLANAVCSIRAPDDGDFGARFCFWNPNGGPF